MLEFSTAIEEDYRFTDAYIEKAILLYDQKKFDASYALLEKATIIDKYIPTLYFWMAKNKQELGKDEDAIYYYQQTLELKPSNNEALESEEMIKKLKK
jgi:tetratricopeptide (TPR) repeat protein